MKRTAIIITILILAVFIIAVELWSRRVGIFSYANFERIKTGMTLSEVEDLLGRKGSQKNEDQLPQIVDHNVPINDPNRKKRVISGEQFYKWEENHCYILVSLRHGKISEKDYWEPSL